MSGNQPWKKRGMSLLCAASVLKKEGNVDGCRMNASGKGDRGRREVGKGWCFRRGFGGGTGGG